jgi:hypothetical protein
LDHSTHNIDRQFSPIGAPDHALTDAPVRGAVGPQVDTRLVAAVQRGAGANCHEAAGLLQQYYLCVENCWEDMDSPDTGYAVTAASRELLHRTKVQLRALISHNRALAGL